MFWPDLLAFWLDLLAAIWFLACWIGYGLYARSQEKTRPCLSNTLDLFRRDWMVRVLKRENRVADASVLGNLERNGAFFASSSLLIIAGLLTMVGYAEQAYTTLQQLRFVASSSKYLLELKLLFLIAVFVYSFFKFTWGMRQYNFCAVMISGAPFPNEEGILPGAREAYALSASRIASLAGESFNLGLRSYYYGLSLLTWFIHPLVFMLTTSAVVFILYHREFQSRALRAMRSGKAFADEKSR